jgi:hypothetical protein
MTVTLLEWLAAVTVVLGSSAVLWAVIFFDGVSTERSRPAAVPKRARGEPPYRKAA